MILFGKIRLVALDLDGTLLDSQRMIPLRNKAAIARAMAAGIYVTICTGRPYPDAKQFAEATGISGGLVVANGAEVRGAKGEILHSNYIAKATVQRLLKQLCSIYTSINLYTKNAVCTLRENRVTKYYGTLHGMGSQLSAIDVRIYDDVDKLISCVGTEVLKIELVDIPIEKSAFLRTVVQGASDVITVGNWGKNVEILATGVSKGNGIIHLANSLGIPMGETMVFGDYNNDISMFSVAGISVAMGNADEQTKGYADLITDTNDHCGVAQILEQLVPVT